MFEFNNIDVQQKFESYPSDIEALMLSLRRLIFETAGTEFVINECMKWNEPSYLCKSGSTIRIDWKQKDSSHLHIYFNCRSKLIETIREIYADDLLILGNRMISIPINQKLPKQILKHCFSLALNYHNIKHLPLLGA